MKATFGQLMALVAIGLQTSSVSAADFKELIVGKWNTEDAKANGAEVTIEFTKEGVLKASVKAGGKSVDIEGKYKFLDEKTVEVSITPPGKAEANAEKMTIKSITADTMIVDKDGKDHTFKKVK